MNDKKSRLLKCGKELFEAKGFKDAKVSEITDMANIATGSFYNYFSSKDELFMEIFLEENLKLKKKIMEQVNVNDDPMKVMKTLMFLNDKGMRENPILKEWYNKDVFSKIEQKYREDNNLDQMNFLYEHFTKVIKQWQSEGKIRSDIEVEMIMAIFTALIMIETHKEEIGIQYFPKLLEYLANFVMKGLMDTSK